MRSWLLILFLCAMVGGKLFAQADSMTVLSYENFMALVKAEHPLARQADLQSVRGQAILRQARGAFDPKAGAALNQKYFEGSNYFSLLKAGLKVPTWFGVTLEAGLEQNDGQYLNPENTTPVTGLWYGGISVPLGKNLLIDERRASLRQARLAQDMAEADRQLLLNEVQLKAGKAYWDWFIAYHQQAIYEEALALAQERAEAIRLQAQIGERAAIDTLEASITVQTRRVALNQVRLDYANASQAISAYLWLDGNIPLELADGTFPASLETVREDALTGLLNLSIDSLTINHPKLQRMDYNLDQLEVQRRLKAEQLKPQLDLNYQPLATAQDGNSPFENFATENYKWGLNFSLPLFLRKERGALQIAKVKWQEADLKRRNTQADLLYKARSARNTWENNVVEIGLWQNMISGYRQLRDGEQIRFDGGESSLFLVNRRESSYISARAKLVKALGSTRKAELETYYALGILGTR